MKLKPHSAFGAWFKEQYGKTPSAMRLARLRKERMDLEDQLAKKTMEFRMEDALHASWTSALRGWNAREK